jgi:enolase
MSKIKNIKARVISDSRGKDTIEAALETEEGKVFVSSVPSGTSTGVWEAKAAEPKKAAENIEKIILPELKGKSVNQQREIDNLMVSLDGTEDKSSLGANAILAVSIACLRAGADSENLALYSYIKEIFKQGSEFQQRENFNLPHPCFLMIEGGKHGGELDIQEFMTIPQKGSFRENFEAGVLIYNKLKELLLESNKKTVIGLEGAFTEVFADEEEALEFIERALIESGLESQTKLYLDCAASSFYKDGSYAFQGEKADYGKLAGFYQAIVGRYPILLLEDPFAEEDWESWAKFNSFLRQNNSPAVLVGDDLTVTNTKRILLAKERGACGAVIIKPNQIGTVTETLEAVKLAKSFGWKIIISHRSGETMDSFIADLAVGVSADFIKSGAVSKKERLAKYKRLLEIEKEIKSF